MILRRAVGLVTFLLLLCGCQGADSPDSPAPMIADDPVVVYASYGDTTYLPEFLEAFSRETGVIVIVRNGEPDVIVNDVIESHVTPPADVLLTPNVAGVWRAADEGALRPLQSTRVNERTAAWLRDPDAFWTAWNYRRAVIAYHPERVAGEELENIRGLADSHFKGRLCLASAADSISLAVITMLLDEIGARETELMVRGWVANLARPPLAAEADVLAAIGSGDCDVGIVSSATFANDADNRTDPALRALEPPSLYVDIEGIGIARHARNPDGARSLIEWLLEEPQRDRHAADMHAMAPTAMPVTRANVSRVAMNREDALKLAERARYR